MSSASALQPASQQPPSPASSTHKRPSAASTSGSLSPSSRSRSGVGAFAFRLHTASSPPSPITAPTKPKRLSIDTELPVSSAAASTAASSSFISALRARAASLSSKRDARACLASTPTGADAAVFRHYCPLCYCYHRSVLTTSCCGHSVCQPCAARFIGSRLPAHLPLAFLPSSLLPIACPACNQQAGVRFMPLSLNAAGQREESLRSYVESPRTRGLLRRAEQAAQAAQATGTELVMLEA